MRTPIPNARPLPLTLLGTSALLAGGLLAGCTTEAPDAPGGGGGDEAPAGLSTEVVLEGLQNPAGVSFSPQGALTVCDAGPGREHGNGRVLLWQDGTTKEHLTGFATEYWKVGADGAPDRFKLGPLNAVWLADGTLVVSNSGLKDGEDNLLFFSGSGTAADGEGTNGIAPTSDDPADKGEGNPTGFALSGDGKTIYVCGQGADAKTWLLTCDVASKELATFASADDHGVAVNSPMQALVWDEDTVLVLYSGAGGKADGTLVAWNSGTGALEAQWELPGLVDPMGMDRIPGTDSLAIVDNNWSLTEVLEGRLAKVTLPEGGGAAAVEPLDVELHGPVSCAFGPDGRLYVAQLGPAFDSEQGSVVAVSGVR